MEARVISSQAQKSEPQMAPLRILRVFQQRVQLFRIFLILPRLLRKKLRLVFRSEHHVVHSDIGVAISMDPGPLPTKLPSVQMNISLDTGKAQGHDIWQPKSTLRIGLLDTGASFNLISHGAYAALNRPMRPCQASVHSIAGDTEICGSIVIEWRFLPDDQRLVGSSKLYGAKFFVLSQSERPLFDCILGWPWLAENWVDVGKLFVANAVDFQGVEVSRNQQ